MSKLIATIVPPNCLAPLTFMIKRTLPLVLLTASLFPGIAAVPSPDKLLPSDTLGMVTIPDYTTARAAWRKSAYHQLWDDPALKPFRDKFMAKLKSDLVEPLEREFGFRWQDYAGTARGQVTLALTQSGWEGKPDTSPGFLLLIDTKDQSSVVNTNLAALKQKWVQSGKQTKTERIRDFEFTALIFTSDDLSKTLEKAFPKDKEADEAAAEEKKKEPKKIEWLVGQADSLLVIGDSAKEIEKVLVRLGGGSAPGLSDQASFASNYGPLFREAQAYGWFNLKAIVDLISKSVSGAESGAKPSMFNPSLIIKALGLNGLQGLAFNLKDAAEGCHINFMLNVPESQRQGLFRILSFPAKEANPPSYVPADAAKFMRWRLDLQKAWATLEGILVDIQPQFAGVIKLIVDTAGKDKDPNFDLRKQLIGNLGDDIISYQKLPRTRTLESLNAPPTLYLLGSPRAEQLASALKALGSSLLPPQTSKMKEREFLGRKLYSLNLPPSRSAADEKPVERTLSFAASGGYLALTTDPPMLEEFLRGNHERSLRDLPGLAQAADQVGGMSTGLFNFENQKETTRATVEALKDQSGTLANLLGRRQLPGRLGINKEEKTANEWFDFSLLPPFDQIAKYFHFVVTSAQVNADGLGIKYFAPRPPELSR